MTRPPPLRSRAALTALVLLALAAPACKRAPAPGAPLAGNAAGAAPKPSPNDLSWLKVRSEFTSSASLVKVEQTFQTATDPTQQRWALAAVAKLGESQGVVWLARIAATDPKLGPAAVDALAGVTAQMAGLQLGDIATSNGPIPIRVAAIRALVAASGLGQIVQLTVLVADPQQPVKVRQQAAVSLGLAHRDEAIASLTSALDETAAAKGHDMEAFRVAIVQALGRIGTSDAQAALDRHLKRTLTPGERAVTESARVARN